MNTKFLLIFVMILNLITVLFAYADYEIGNGTTDVNYYMVDWIIKTDNLNVADLSTIKDQGGVETASGFQNATKSLNNEQASGTGDSTGFFSILDTAKMVLAFFSLLTPIPAITFFGSAGLPVFWAMFLGAIIGALYFIGIIEFWKGGQL